MIMMAAVTLGLFGCARYQYERTTPVAISGTNVVLASERTTIWSAGSKTGLEGVTSETTDGKFHRKVGASAVKTQGDADLVEAATRGAVQGFVASQGGGAGALMSSAGARSAQNPPLNPGGTVHPEIKAGNTNAK